MGYLFGFNVCSEKLMFVKELVLFKFRKEIYFFVCESEDWEIMIVILEIVKRKIFMYIVVGCDFGRENV